MRVNQSIILIFLITTLRGYSQLYLPQVAYYNHAVERIALVDSQSTDYFKSHLSMKPILDFRTTTDSIYFSSEKHYYWITQKLFKENFLIFKGDDFWISVDPILDLELGGDFSADSLTRLYWNTRGIRIEGKLFQKVGFTTSFYENQAILPNYQSDYATQHGEFFPNGANTKYTQNNAVIPGYARTKPFKTTGFDFAYAQGSVSYVPSEHLNFQVGNGNQFIGNGYRSLLLSDFTTNYPFAKIETNWWNGRIQYNAIYALHQNLYRLHDYTTPESTYEKKIGTYHYLDVAINKHVQIGFFEGSLWQRVDSLGTHKPDPIFLNPLPANVAIKGFESTGYKSIMGFNFSTQFAKTMLYAQVVIDRKALGGFQVGGKIMDVFIPKLDVAVEYNRVELNTYQSADKRYNYSHFNLPLAHPYINGFQELTAQISFESGHFFVTNRINYSQRIQADSLSVGNSILFPSGTINREQSHKNSIIYNQFEMGYRFNKRYNLMAFIGHLYRNETSPTDNPLTNYAYIGIRTQLKNKYVDY